MVVIAAANSNDFATIRDLAHAIWPNTYGHILSKEQLEFMLDSFYSEETLKNTVALGHRYVLVTENGKALGFMGYEHRYKGRAVTRIHKIYVLPETQGRGIGKSLIVYVEELAVQNHSQVLSLNVNRFNDALGFYRRMGFEVTGQEDIEIGRGYLMEDFTMEKRL